MQRVDASDTITEIKEGYQMGRVVSMDTINGTQTGTDGVTITRNITTPPYLGNIWKS